MTDGSLTRFRGAFQSGSGIVSASEVLFVDTERGTYQRFTLSPTDVEGDVRRITQYAAEKGSELANEALIRANLLDLHGRRLSLHAEAMRASDAEVQQQRQSYCTTSAHVEVRSWEPLGFPVVLTELSTSGVGTPSHYHLRRSGRCWANPEINVRLFTTHWFLSSCTSRTTIAGNVFITRAVNTSYNDDFPANITRLWVRQIPLIFFNDQSGATWLDGTIGASGGSWASRFLLAHGVNHIVSYARGNCR